jgi:PAS domain S-box-containing protein
MTLTEEQRQLIQQNSKDSDAYHTLVALIEDIQTAAKAEAQLRMITDNMLDLVSQTDVNFIFQYASPSHYRVLGYLPEELIGRSVFDFVHPDDVVSALESSLNTPDIGEQTLRYRRADGSYLWLEIHGKLVRDENGQPAGAVFGAREVTARREAEMALRASEARFRALVNSTDDIVFTLDQEQRHTGVYGRWMQQQGYSPDFFLGKTPAEVVDAATAAIHESANRRALKGETVLYEWLLEGEYYQTSVSPLLQEDGHIAGVVGIGRNITRLKQLEQELREKQSFIEQITNTIPDMVYLYDVVERRNIYTNHAVEQILGYTSAEIQAMGSSLAERLIHPEDRQLKKEHSRLNKATVETEMRFCHANGEWRWLRARETVFQRDVNGAPRLILGIAQDITRHKQTEEALKASEALHRQIAELVPVAVMITDMETLDVVFHNPVAVRWLQNGYTDSIRHWYHNTPEAYAGSTQDRFALLRQGQAVPPMEYHVQMPDGHEAFISSQSIPMMYQGRRAFMNVIIDLTEQKRTEQWLIEQERLQTSLRKVEELNQFKSKMMLRISHEFRTPLAVIQLASETINRYTARITPEKRQELAYRISSQIQHLTTMLDEISFIVLNQAHPIHLKLTTFDLNELSQEIVGRFRGTAGSETPIEFIVSEHYVVRADRGLIQTLIISLLSNAIKFSPEASSVLFTLRRAHELLEIRVIDQGIGIPEEDQQHIFEPFYRGNNINEIRGMGLGLSIAQEIVRAHGGNIQVESAVRAGTIFTVQLPILTVDGESRGIGVNTSALPHSALYCP